MVGVLNINLRLLLRFENAAPFLGNNAERNTADRIAQPRSIPDSKSIKKSTQHRRQNFPDVLAYS